LFCFKCLRHDVQEKKTCEELTCFECAAPIALADILILFSPVELETLFGNLKNQYLLKNRSRFVYCPTPSCENILERAGENNVVFCTSCGADTCFLCSKPHYGDTLCNKRAMMTHKVFCD
jgi:hypothetical protein